MRIGLETAAFRAIIAITINLQARIAIDRRTYNRLSIRFMFALALLLLGLALPLASAALSPASAGLAAAALPTARVRMPTLESGVTLAQRPTDSEQPAVAQATPAASSEAQPQDVPTAVPAPTSTPPLPGPADLAPAAPPEMGPLAGPVPILMYHYIRDVDEAADPLGYNLSITPADFEQQIAWLHEQGYVGVRMDMLARCMRGEIACPLKPIGLTFDDGYEDAFTTALPVLQRYGMVATFYIVSGLVGQPGYMSWEQLAALRDAGMELGAHSVNHYDLTSLDTATAGYEIAQPKADLEARLGIGVTSFCYPTGIYNAAIEEQVRAAGYQSATTTRWDGDYSDMMALPRRRVAGGTPLDGFAAIVGGY